MKTEYSFDNETWYDAPEGKAFVPGVGEIYLRMTNETTASQPKSIGDDAQFCELLRDYMRAFNCDWTPTAEVDEKHQNFIAYIDSRAPAAQASATIQAAPEYRVGWFWSSANPGKKVRCLAEGKEIAEYEKRGDFIGWCDAATIQEPVMVAEPVGWKHAANEWADAACNGLQWLRNIEDGITTDVKVARENMESSCQHAKQVAASVAAPMVADPAGVAGDDAAKAMHWFSCLEECAKLLGLPDDEPIPSGVVKAVRTLAATVKAVPSEALELAGMVVKATFGDHKILVPRVDLSGKGIGTLVYFAAPLADKTGGGK